jgi:hypothetical protein
MSKSKIFTDNAVPHNTLDMFKYWVKTKRFEYPGIQFKNKYTKAIIVNKDEIAFQEQRIEHLENENERLEWQDNDKKNFTTSTKRIYNNKKEIYDRRQKLKDLRKKSPNDVHVIGDYAQFRHVIELFNVLAANRIVFNAETINLGNQLGYIRIEKVLRTRMMINWKQSLEFKAELEKQGIPLMSKDNPNGRKWLVFITDPYYVRWVWVRNKGQCKVHNHSVYTFKPTKGNNGNKRLLSNANKKDVFLHKEYKVRNHEFKRKI